MSHCGVSSTALRINLGRCEAPDEAPGTGPFPEPPLSTLGILTSICKEADRVGGYLCGGAIRDYILLGEPSIKDFDIFIPFDGKVRKGIDYLLFGNVIEMPKDFIDKTREEVLAISKYPSVNVDVILIDRKTVLEIVGTFDATICEAWVEWVNDEPHVVCSGPFFYYLCHEDWYTYRDIPTTGDHTERLVAKFGKPSGSLTSTGAPVPIRLGPLKGVRKLIKMLRERAK